MDLRQGTRVRREALAPNTLNCSCSLLTTTTTWRDGGSKHVVGTTPRSVGSLVTAEQCSVLHTSTRLKLFAFSCLVVLDSAHFRVR